MNLDVHKIAVPWVLVLMTATFSYGGEETGEELFISANQAYKMEDFEAAIAQYEAIIRLNGENGHVFFNLGNAYFRVNDLGRAILNYERSRRYLPRDADLAFNLEYAREQMKDAISQEQTTLDMVFFWLDDLSPSEVYWIFVAVHVLFFGVLVCRQLARTEWSYYLLLFTMGLWLICGTSYGLKDYRLRNDDRVIVISEEANVLAGLGEGNTLLFKLHAGTMARFERAEEAWSLIRLSDEKRGWVESSRIGHVRSPASSGKSG